MKLRKTTVCLLALVLSSCGDTAPSASANGDSQPAADVVSAPEPAVPEAPGEVSAAPIEEPERISLEQLQDELGIPAISAPWAGDLDGMAERRVIRVLTVYGAGRYYLDGAEEKGITHELLKLFEKFINERFKRKTVRIHVAFIPVARDELIPGLIAGRGDIAVAGLTITPERDELVDFSAPVSRELSEVLVTGPSAPPIESIDDLAGQEIYVRASSSYRSSIDALNARFRDEGKAEIIPVDGSEHLEDEDLLEMVNAGMLDWAIVDSWKAEAWAGVFDKLVVRDDVVFRTGGRLGWAFRENSPQLESAVNEFLKSHRQGTLTGNILINRYIRDFDWAANALAEQDYERFESLRGLFERYGSEYGFDYLIVAAQGYQESRLDQSARSGAGAIGIMQLLPSTAADPNVGIPDISSEEPNIHAGIRYLDFIRKRYFSDLESDPYNQTLFALAAYNAGPARVTRLRKKAEEQGYDRNRWFDNVEMIAAREIGRETVQYVANIVKYYVAYQTSMVSQLQRGRERERIGIDTDGR